MNRTLKAVVLCAGGALGIPLASAGTQTYGFTNISGNNATNAAAGETQLRVTVSMLMGGKVGFHFFHMGNTPMTITQIYFDDNTPRLGAADAPAGSMGVAFAPGGAPPDLPAGNNAMPVFLSNRRFTANSPAPTHGVSPGETLDLSFSIIGLFADVLADINSGELRIGIHVQAFGNGGSESFVNEPQDPVRPIPLPTAGAMGLAGLLLAGSRRRR